MDRSNNLELMLMNADQESLHDLKDGLAGGQGRHKTKMATKPNVNGNGQARRLNNLQRAHHGSAYNKLTNMFGKITKLD